MLDDLRDLVSAALRLPDAHPAQMAVSDPRFIAATLHCLARLYERLALRQDAAFGLLLRHALRPGGMLESSSSATPHSLAQFAWSVGFYPRDIVVQAANAILTSKQRRVGRATETADESAVSRSIDLLWDSLAVALERIAASPSCDITPGELSMLASAAVHSGGAAPRLFGAIAELALQRRQQRQRPLSSFSGSVLVALPSALAAAHSAWARSPSSSSESPRARPRGEDAAPGSLGSAVFAAVSSSVSPSVEGTASPGNSSLKQSPVSHPSVVRLLMAIVEEVAARLVAAEDDLDQVGIAPRGDSRRRVVLGRRSEDSPPVQDPGYARLPAIFARAHGIADSVSNGSEVGVVTALGTLPDGSMMPPLPVTLLAPLLRAYATLGFNSPQLFSSVSRFLGLVSASSGSDSGGREGFRPLGSHADDRFAPHAGSHRPAAMHENADGDVAIISTAPFKSLVVFASAFARARYADEEDTPRMWAALLASSASHVQAASETVGREVKGSKESVGMTRSPERTFKPHWQVGQVEPVDIAALLHALVDASVPAKRLSLVSLEHLRCHVDAYPLPALARLLWATAMQGVYDPCASEAAFRRVASLVASASHGGTTHGAHRGDFPAAMLAVSEESAGPRFLPAVRAAQSQLYMAWLGLSLEGHKIQATASVAAALDAMPPALISTWRSAYAASNTHNHRSLLHAEVSRLLGLAGIEHSCEVLLPEGLCVDVVVPAAQANVGVRRSPALQRKPHVVLEVNGPSHYAPAVQAAPEVPHASGAARGGALGTVWPEDTKLPPHALTSLKGLTLDTDDPLVTPGAAPPVPSLRTRARSRWLAAAGYETVTLDWAEWASHPSTEERLELLAEKGLCIPRHLLSY